MGFVNKLVVTSLVIICCTQFSFAQTPELLWEKRYDGGSSDIASGVATGRDGNITVTGASESNYLTIKYDSNGNVLWKVPYDSGGLDTAYAVATDSLNNIIVAGTSTIYEDWYIVKYNEGGGKIWSKTLNLGRSDIARAVSVDSNNNIIVTGYATSNDSATGLTWDYFTVKYDSNGDFLWYKNYNLWDDRAYDVTVDSNDSVIVVGASDGGNGSNIHTIKYDSNGRELWGADFDSGYKDYGYGVATDSADNVIVVGYSYDPSTVRANCVILKYDSMGGELWRRTYSRSSFDQAFCVTIDRYDNIIVGGKANGAINIMIYDGNGRLLWDYNHSNFVGAANSVDVDVYNDIVVAGFLYSSSTGSDFQIMKFSGYGSSTPTTTTTTTTVTTTTTSTTSTTIPTTTTVPPTTTTTTTTTTSTTTTTTRPPTTTSSTTTTTTRTTTTTSSTTTTLPPQNICADPVSFYFEATIPGPNPVNQMLMVSECKGYNISWSAERSDSWLSLSQAQDTTLMEVSVDVSGISNEGVYNGSIIILAEGTANSPLEIPVTLKATKAPLPVENLEARRVEDGSILLKWDANDAYDLAGYKVYYDFDGSQPPYNGAGASEGNSGEVFIFGAETAQLTGLPGGVMYVAVTAFDHEGNESDYSNAVIPNSVRINNGDERAFIRDVTLYLTYGVDITRVSISNDGKSWSKWLSAKPVIKWRLSTGYGKKSVYVMFKGNGRIYEPAKDTIMVVKKTSR